jgi:hypothetical protein
MLALACFAIALAIRISRIGDNAQRRWYDARAAAESIKSASWQFAVGGEAYRKDDATAATRFQADLHRYLGQLSHLTVPTDSPSECGVTAPIGERVAAYIAHRVQDQMDWYATSATRNGLRARRWWLMLVIVEASALIVGLARVAFGFDVDWLGVLAALAASLAAWQQAKRYTELSESYAVTSHEVGLIKAASGECRSERSWAQFVHDAEAAFSREHTLWLARRQGPLD